MRHSWLTATFFVLNVPASFFAQKMNIRLYHKDEGLPQNQSLAIRQDTNGYVWVGTRGDLSRFKGRTWTTYSKRQGRNSISVLERDRLGRLWVGNAHEMNTPIAAARASLLELKNLTREYSDSGGNAEVTLLLLEDEGDLLLQISDVGSVIKSDHLAKIFGSMSTTKPFGEGTGLGLTIVHDIITGRLGGTISVMSEPNKGASFSLRFPKYKEKTRGPN